MLKLNTQKIKISDGVLDSIRGGIEAQLTYNNYTLISETAQEAALKEQAQQRKKGCYDDNCLVATGKMLAARELFVMEISFAGSDYIFKLRMVDLESGETKGSSTDFYPKDHINNLRKTYQFAKKITEKALQKRMPQRVKPAGVINHTQKIVLKPLFYTTLFDNPDHIDISTTTLACYAKKNSVSRPYKSSCIYELSKDGYYNRTLNVTFDRDQTIAVKLKKIPFKTVTFEGLKGVTVTTDQAECRLKDGVTRLRAETKCNWQLSKPYFYTEHISKTIREDETIIAKLAPLEDAQFRYKAYYPVMINCRDQYGQNYLMTQHKKVPEGVYHCDYKAKNYAIIPPTPTLITLKPGKNDVVNIRMVPSEIRGYVRVSQVPQIRVAERSVLLLVLAMLDQIVSLLKGGSLRGLVWMIFTESVPLGLDLLRLHSTTLSSIFRCHFH